MAQPLPAPRCGHTAGPIIAVLLAAALLLGQAWAQSSGGPYEIPRYSIHAGGQTSSGGDFTLTASPGQAEAAPVSAEGAPYTLTGGLLARGRLLESNTGIFSDGFE